MVVLIELVFLEIERIHDGLRRGFQIERSANAGTIMNRLAGQSASIPNESMSFRHASMNAAGSLPARLRSAACANFVQS